MAKEVTKPESERRIKAAERARKLSEKSRESFAGKQLGGFMEFVREQGVVGLAIGLAIGTAATVLVKSIVDNIITPIIGYLLPGSGSLSTKSSCLASVDGQCVNVMNWGLVVSNLISFFAIAALIYFVVKGFRLDKLDKKKT